MPRKSPFIIIVEENNISCHRICRHVIGNIRHRIESYTGKDYPHHRACLENDEIANCLDTTRQIVSKWRKRFYEKSFKDLPDQLH